MDILEDLLRSSRKRFHLKRLENEPPGAGQEEILLILSVRKTRVENRVKDFSEGSFAKVVE